MTPADPRMTVNAYGLRFCGMRTLGRTTLSASATKSNSRLAKISRSSARRSSVSTNEVAWNSTWANGSVCHIASRMCSPGRAKPSASAAPALSLISGEPLAAPEPAGLSFTFANSDISRLASRRTGSANDSR
ncbi:unannotated protein [freshwater metagenome]|uniref:Unannotated protein n=1 Tax=freshwater metagenome TaxID=449393 RepID=A0A6J7MII9_9ZZZZ